jgi:hypothetical protein
MDLNDISNLPVMEPNQLVVTIAAHKAAVEILMEWLKQVEGIAINSEYLKKQFLETYNAEFIMKFDNSEQDY